MSQNLSSAAVVIGALMVKIIKPEQIHWLTTVSQYFPLIILY